MDPPRNLLSVLLLQLFLTHSTFSGKVLIWPGEYSHWLNMKCIMEKLVDSGHTITVLTHSGAQSITYNQTSRYHFEVFPVPFTKQMAKELLDKMLRYWTYDLPHDSFIQASLKIKAMVEKLTDQQQQICRALFRDKELLHKLRQSQYDVLLSDPMTFCGDLLAETLGLPFIYTLRFSFGNTMERMCGQIPAPASYVPSVGMEYTDRMSFVQRLKNLLFYWSQDFIFYTLASTKWDALYTEIAVMTLSKWVLSVLCLQLCTTQTVLSGKVLIWPGEFSHWLNMKSIIEELLNRNHSVTVLIHSGSPSINYRETKNYHFEVFDVSFPNTSYSDLADEVLNFWMYESMQTSFIGIFLKIRDILQRMLTLNKDICEHSVKNKELMAKLKQAQYDVLLSDPVTQCSEVLAEHLGLPFIYSMRMSFANVMERLCGQMPAPPSYVPATPIQYTDKMSFMERLRNLRFYLIQDLLFYEWTFSKWDTYYSEILGKPTTFCETMGKADIWLIRTYWDFEYPRPFLPNFQFVGGLHCKPAKPLPEAMEEFVQRSGDDGIVVFSLGSMIKNLTSEKANMIASALGQIKQKVLWRYSGKKPDTLAPNTRVYDWIPQNDLLGHPKAKAFITHGGTNGIYEAIYHGIPMVGIPMFADQPDNMVHMKSKGAAVVLDFNKMESKDLVEALNTVLYDKSYKENVMRLSRIHHDQPMSPLDRAVFWIEFVMRHKGAKHLRVQAHNLTWYQYHSLDVIAVLLACVAAVTFIFIKMCSFCFRKCCKRSKTKSKKE
ncbi:UDP-glucuronosyltransferase 2A2-like isoform X1 [Amia ocellicauda]|uniref:UDP-glucuronosyltransferase 2A2-like isoform X1 n=2 Tax=Amia ocellicauda TaxID=2972642 RepID=UPI00346409C2